MLAAQQPKLPRHCGRVARILDLPPSRSICASITMQSALGGRPHRSQRSHSPQENAGLRGGLATLASTILIALVTRILSSFCT